MSGEFWPPMTAWKWIFEPGSAPERARRIGPPYGPRVCQSREDNMICAAASGRFPPADVRLGETACGMMEVDHGISAAASYPVGDAVKKDGRGGERLSHNPGKVQRDAAALMRETGACPGSPSPGPGRTTRAAGIGTRRDSVLMDGQDVQPLYCGVQTQERSG